MKLSKRIPALALVFVLVLSALTGCSNNKLVDVAPPDEVAVALFDIVIRDDAAAITEALGYPSEADARADFLGEDGSLYESLASEFTNQLSALGTVTDADSQRLVDAFLAMMNKLTFTAEVKEQSDKDRTAVVTCHVSTFPADAMETAVTDAFTALATENPDLANDPDALVGALVEAMATAMESLEPTDDMADFDADFTLEQLETNGKAKWVWIPADAEGFGAALSSNAMGG